MKQSVLFLIGSLSYLISVSQEITPRELKGFGPTFIGDSISKFKNSIICIDASSLNQPFNERSKCRSYRFVPDPGDSIEIGPLKFHGAVLFLDSQKRVNAILHARKFEGKNRKAKAMSQERDFEALRVYFDTYFQVRGQEKIYPKSKYNKEDGLVWKSGKYTLTVEKLTFTTADVHILNVTVSVE
jgi:hypothetical protein